MTTTTHWPMVGASIAVFKDDQILLVKRAKPPALWSLPGGQVEPGERAADAALRELMEETGITADLIGLNDTVDAIFHEPGGDLRAHYLIASFYGRWRAGEPVADTDVSDAQWASIDELINYKLTPNAENLIRQAHAKLTSV